jgi:hypothetical protein
VSSVVAFGRDWRRCQDALRPNERTTANDPAMLPDVMVVDLVALVNMENRLLPSSEAVKSHYGM